MNYDKDFVYKDSIKKTRAIADGIPVRLLQDIERALRRTWRSFVASFNETDYRIKDRDRERAAESEHRPDGSAIKEIIKIFKNRDMRVELFTQHIYKIGCNEALLILVLPKCMEIVEDLLEGDIKVEEDGEVTFSVKAVGIPIPDYQWYHNEEPLTGETSPILHLKDLRLSSSGNYYCKFRQESIFQELDSRIVNLIVLEFPSARPSSPNVLKQTNLPARPDQNFTFLMDLSERIQVTAGRVHQYAIVVSGEEQNFKFVWYLNKEPIGYYKYSYKRKQLPLFCFLDMDSIIFNVLDESACRCRVNHDQNCQFSGIAPVNNLRKSTIYINTNNIESYVDYEIVCLVESISIKKSKMSKIMHFICDNISSEYHPTQKIALLFGCSEYHFYMPLKPIEKKMQMLEQKLESLKFETFSFLNLSQIEMIQAIELIRKLIQPNAYFVFYYVGHGFTVKNSPTTFLTTPDSSLSELNCCLTDTYVFNKLNGCKELLNAVFIFDTCRANCVNDDNIEIRNLQIQKKGDGYLKIYPTIYGLKNYIGTNEKDKNFVDYFVENIEGTLSHLLLRVQKSLSANENQELRQKMHIDFTMGLDRSLADTITLNLPSNPVKIKTDMFIKNTIARANPLTESENGRWLRSNDFGIRYKLIKVFSNVLTVHILWKQNEGYYHSNIIVDTEQDTGIECVNTEDNQNSSVAHGFKDKYFTFKSLQRFKSLDRWVQKFYYTGEDSSGRPKKKIEFNLRFEKPLIIALKSHFTSLQEAENARIRTAEENTDASDDSH